VFFCYQVGNHMSKICSTWGRDHVKTFDGEVYQFPGMCEYKLATDCHESFNKFSVHIRREEDDGNITISYVVVTINDRRFYFSKSLVTEDSKPNKKFSKNNNCFLHYLYYLLRLSRAGRKISPIEFGNSHKVLLPNDDCKDPYEKQEDSEEDMDVPDSFCKEMLQSNTWGSCTDLIKPEDYIQACVKDMCTYSNGTRDLCVCSTMSEFSRQCSYAGGKPPNWRKPHFCAKQCPYNMVFEESGSPCMDTCTHQDTSSLCEDHQIDGCFCPPGTVFDDISKRGCIPQSECQCKHGKIYDTGDVYRQGQRNCTCFEGRWKCVSLETPALCSVEEGSHFTTFDGKTFTFHGDCYYTLAKVESKVNLSFLVVFLLVLLQTTFGLHVQIQNFPLMQVYISLDQSYRTKSQGLCGNFNMDLSDDLKTPQGAVEGTSSTFCNSWKAKFMCTDSSDRLDEPCSNSVEIEKYAKHWCNFLRSSNSSFTKCHSEVNPDIYYKRCIYSSCNCEKSEDCLCSVLFSYAHACAAKGVFLKAIGKDVSKQTKCPASQVFSYQQQCPKTCRSLASEEQSCTLDPMPVGGCFCPRDRYLNEKDNCVPIEECSCHLFTLPPPSFLIDLMYLKVVPLTCTECQPPKVFFNCSTASPENRRRQQCPRTCLNLDLDECDSTECTSGCMCPPNHIEDGRGSCVKDEKDCPCQHNHRFYSPKQQVHENCRTLTCKDGKWETTERKCSGTCIIYGSGHHITFDQQTYEFQGQCPYVAVKVNSWKENSDSMYFRNYAQIQLGRTEIKLTDGTYEEAELDSNSSSSITYNIRRVGLYLLVETSIGLTVIWDRKTYFQIHLEPEHRNEVCGLCGNFDGNGQNDYMAQNQMLESDPIKFANSWETSSSCPDVKNLVDACEKEPNRFPWAKMKCSILKGDAFKDCHTKVDPNPFYENCVKDSCACDTGGDCECFCSAVAAYAQACNEADVSIEWRTPDICRKWIQCVLSMCFNVAGFVGCYPTCPEDWPIFDEKTQTCTNICTTSTTTTTVTPTTTIESTTTTITPTPSTTTTITTTTSTRSTTTPTTTTESPTTSSTTITPTTITTTTITTTSPTPCIYSPCQWSEWYDVDNPDKNKSDYETYKNITKNNKQICSKPEKIDCRSQNETFYFCNCTMAKCVENNTIEIVPYECPPLQQLTCANGKSPVLVYDEYHCCQHYECDCECEGWGDPHYITFDGFYYSYQGNCTYALMKEIIPKHDLQIHIDNVLCDPTEDVSCPRSLIIYYGSQHIKLKNHNLNGRPNLKVTQENINLVLEIPRLRVVVQFGRSGFSVTLPYQYFGGNTQGHCGTCTNNQDDDCKLPEGGLAKSCAVMADYWVSLIYPLYFIFHHSVFEECHSLVSPDNFYTGCVFDSCHVKNPAIECTSLEVYAAACAEAGVCIYWRNHTSQCGTKISLAIRYFCGLFTLSPNDPKMNFTTEGCFCPEGMKLFNKESDICVKSCGKCTKSPTLVLSFQLNETFEYKCQNCVCNEFTKTVTCKDKVCPTLNIQSCSGEGFILVNETDPSDPCCTVYDCRKTCNILNGTCSIGFRPTVSVPEGKCCPVNKCGELFDSPGSAVPGNKCETCICSRESSSQGLLSITCEKQICNKTCEMVSTIIAFPYSLTGNKCENHTCFRSGKTFTAISSQIVCPPVQESNCQPVTNGCCKTCEYDLFLSFHLKRLLTMKTRIRHKGCESEQEVDMPYCEGSCNTFSKYSELVAGMNQTCSCCKEMRFRNNTVDLKCHGEHGVHGVVSYTYMLVEECGCSLSECTPAAEHSARRKRSFTLV
uniref:Mucin 2, oligomeric mucus/gel-forming n=1 Tax=Kryptolebias marmoratus TaxID=37003 RepID=A0A3Q3BFU2_KRYMA